MTARRFGGINMRCECTYRLAYSQYFLCYGVHSVGRKSCSPRFTNFYACSI